MNKKRLKKIIQSCLSDVYFSYNNKPCGVTSTVKDFIPTYQAWCGDKIKEYNNVEEVMEDKFYFGKSLVDLIDIINID